MMRKSGLFAQLLFRSRPLLAYRNCVLLLLRCCTSILAVGIKVTIGLGRPLETGAPPSYLCLCFLFCSHSCRALPSLCLSLLLSLPLYLSPVSLRNLQGKALSLFFSLLLSLSGFFFSFLFCSFLNLSQLFCQAV